MNAAAESIITEGIPPRELEEGVLYSCIGTTLPRGKAAYLEALGIISASTFTSDTNRAIWLALGKLHDKGEDFAGELIAREMGSMRDYRMNRLYVAAVLDMPRAPFVGAYARAMKVEEAKREVRARLERTLAETMPRDLSTTVEAIRATLEYGESAAADMEPGVQIIDNTRQEEAYEAHLTGLGSAGLKTGWGAIDRNGGLLPGELLTIVARPKVGKSALAQNLCLNVVEPAAERVCLYFTLEMPVVLWRERWVQIACVKNRQWVHESRSDPIVRAMMEQVGGVKLARPKKTTLESLRRHCEAVQRDSGRLDLVVIDHVDFVELGNPGENLADRVRGFYVGVKKLAGDLECPFCVLHQGSREGGDGTPIARGSEGPREVSDLMLGATRPGMETEEGGRVIKLKAIVARRMPPIYTELTFDPETLVIRDDGPREAPEEG